LVELTPQQIAKLYEFIGIIPPKIVTENDISHILIEIEKKFTPISLQEKNTDKPDIENNEKILVIDDLEVSLFQLTKLLSKSGYNMFVARNTEEAKDLYKKHDYDYVFLDLFLPEPEDGINLLENIKSIDKTTLNNTKIIVISGSDDKKLINQCFVKGADDFISKTDGWHKKILDKLRCFSEIKRGPMPGLKTIIEDEKSKIATIKIKNIFKPGVIDDLKKESINLLLSGYNNLILDLENVLVTNPEVLNVIVYIFKYYSSHSGAIKLCNVSTAVSESLSYVFLDGIIPLHSDKLSALNDFYETTGNEV